MDPLPQVIGVCAHCGQDLYGDQPMRISDVHVDIELMAATGLKETVARLSHVGCAVDALRER